MSDDRTDMNDLARVSGVEAVRAAIDAAQPPTREGGTNNKARTRAKAARSGASGSNRTKVNHPREEGEPSPPDRFTLDDGGLFYRPPGDEDAGRRRVCDPLRIIAFARDVQSNGWALLVEFETPDHDTRRLLVPLAALGGDGAEWRRALLQAGFMVPTDANRRRWLTDYLVGRRPSLRVRLVDRMGWCVFQRSWTPVSG